MLSISIDFSGYSCIYIALLDFGSQCFRTWQQPKDQLVAPIDPVETFARFQVGFLASRWLAPWLRVGWLLRWLDGWIVIDGFAGLAGRGA